MKPNHTPTPWHRNVSPAWKYPIYADKNGNPNGKEWIHIAAVLSGNPNAETDLDFIIRAVNSHEALITGIEAAIIHVNNEEVKKMLRNILAKAEEN